MRMSSGPSRVKEKPRAASSSWGEETPRSSTAPSSRLTPWPPSSVAASPKQPSIMVKLGQVRASARPRATAAGSRSIASTRPAPAARIARL